MDIAPHPHGLPLCLQIVDMAEGKTKKKVNALCVCLFVFCNVFDDFKIFQFDHLFWIWIWMIFGFWKFWAFFQWLTAASSNPPFRFSGSQPHQLPPYPSPCPQRAGSGPRRPSAPLSRKPPKKRLILLTGVAHTPSTRWSGFTTWSGKKKMANSSNDKICRN